MRIFKTSEFIHLIRKEGITDSALKKAVDEIENGLFEANLGGGVYKKRLARPGQGKSGSYRIIVCFKEGSRTFFIHSFAKSEQDNINSSELKDFKELAKILFSMTDERLETEIISGTFQEITE